MRAYVDRQNEMGRFDYSTEYTRDSEAEDFAESVMVMLHPSMADPVRTKGRPDGLDMSPGRMRFVRMQFVRAQLYRATYPERE